MSNRPGMWPEATKQVSRLDDLAFVSLRFHRLVVRLLAALLRRLDILVLALETAAVLFLGDNLLQHGLLALLVLQTAAVELSSAFDDSADLGECRNITLLVVLLVVAVGVKDVPHLE